MMIKKWLAKLRAQRTHKALVKEARNDWRVVISRTYHCGAILFESKSGVAVIVGEENQLGERRLRSISDPRPRYNHEYKAEIMLWVAKAQPRALPRHELEKA